MIARVGWLRWKLPESSGAGLPDGAGGIGAAAIAMVAVFATGAAGRAMLDVEAAPPPLPTVITVGREIPTADTWTERLSDPSAWRRGRYVGDRRGRRPARLDQEDREDPEEFDEDDEDRPPERTGFGGNSYRTVCVRLCDGFFFPISFATTPENFARDSAACSARCNSPARLYVYPNPGGEPEQMVGLDGKPYSALKSAFLFRTKYDAACTCKAQPWSKEALAQHRAFADAQKKAGTRTVARTIRSNQPRIDATSNAGGNATHGRPQGAMLLGADQPPPRAARKSVVQPKSASRSRGSSGGRGDWQRRAFSGD